MGASPARDETASFGRSSEIADVEARLARGARIVSILGPPGVGKTHLVSRIGRDKRGVYVGLGHAGTLEAALNAVASAVHVRIPGAATPDEAARALAPALVGKVLVLDGLEPLGPAAKELVDRLLSAASDLVVLAASRAAVGVRDEEKVVLAPLDEADAIALLRDRARLAAGKPVPIADEDARAIVTKLDRLPLAIELAAARLKLLSPPELERRLVEDAQTMQSALAASWELLDDAEKSALAQCSLFAAPFGVEAAEEVVVVPGRETLELLEGLLDKSLVTRAEGAGPARLHMYETFRAWAKTKLAADDEARVRHARHHVEEAEAWAARAYGPDAERAFDALAALLPELLAVVERFEATTPAMAARAALAAIDLVRFRAYPALRGQLFARALACAERAEDEALLARALVAKARITLEDARVGDAEAELARAIALAEKIRDAEIAAEARRSMGWALVAANRLADAEKELDAAIAAHRAQGSARGEADGLVALGLLRAFQGRGADSLACLRDALAIHVEHGDVVRQEKVLAFATLAGHAPAEVARGLPRDVLARAPNESLDVVPAPVRDVVASAATHKAGWSEALACYGAGVAATDPKSALASFEAALAALAKAGISRGASSIRAHAAVALAEMRDFAEADAWLARAREEAEGVPGAAIVVDAFGGVVAALRGDADGAAAAAARARRADPSPELAQALALLDRFEAATESSPPSIAAPALVVAKQARSFVLGAGKRVDLTRYGPVRRLLDALVEARLTRPGEALSADALIEAGWPGERMRHTAGLLRVYSAVRRLRRLGLEGVLVTRDDGYLLDPAAVVRRETS